MYVRSVAAIVNGPEAIKKRRRHIPAEGLPFTKEAKAADQILATRPQCSNQRKGAD